MDKQPIINEKSNGKWSNWHRSLDVGGKANKIFQPLNQYKNDTPPAGREFEAGLEGLKAIVQKAQNEKKRVRAHGSGWSLNNIAFTDEFLVDSNELDYVKVGMKTELLTENYTHKSKLLVFAQCGIMVKQLNTVLEAHQLALPTSGASDGQRIVGAIATGTHGSAHAVGAMTEFVRGIHIVIPGKHVYLQRASDKVVTKEFGKWLNGAEILNDDDLFNAALVGFGGFGLIHGLLIETESQYLLERVIRHYEVSEVRNAITEWDFSGLDLPYDNKMPFHFECVLNPYPIGENEKGAYVRAYYRHEATDELVVDPGPPSDTPDLHTAMALQFDDTKGMEFEAIFKESDLEDSVSTKDKAVWMGFIMQIALKKSFPIKPPEEPIRAPGKWFYGEKSGKPKTSAPVAGTSIELGVPFEHVGEAMDLVLKVANEHPFAAPLAFRYVKRSSATLGFTGLADITVTMEMPGPFGKIFFPNTGQAHEELFKALGASDIPHSFHWGQKFPKNKTWVPKIYGAAAEQWKSQRKKLLGESGIKIFSNQLMSEIGLDTQPLPSFMNRFWERILSFIMFWKKPAT